MENELKRIQQEVVQCTRCPRLVAWREKVAREKTRRFRDSDYWGKPVPSFGDPRARLLIVGLAPAAHGANRTGRMFTGDRSGNWLYRALHKAGFANQPTSQHRGDGLRLQNGYITALARCAPPANKPTAEEFANCAPYLKAEWEVFLKHWSAIPGPGVALCLGQLAFRHTLILLESLGRGPFKPRPRFRHGLEMEISPNLHLLASYHPSQQNTFTGRLTEEMIDQIFQRVNEILRENPGQ